MKDDAMTPEISDETLMAFADGVLDEPLFSRVADAVEQDSELAHRLEALIRGGTLARRAYAPLLQPVSPELEARVRAAIGRPQGLWRIDWPGWRWLTPVAAGMAAVAAVVLVLLVERGTPRSTHALDGFGGAALLAALDTLGSGEMLQDGETEIRIVATFDDGAGTLCREFETPAHLVITCREEGDWALRLAVAGEGGGETYSPASGAAAVDAYLQSIGAGEPILDQAEIDRLAALRRER